MSWRILIGAVALTTLCGASKPPVRSPVPPPEAVARAVENVRLVVEGTRAVRGSYPAISVVVSGRSATPLLYVAGETKARGGRPVTPHTPFYIASQTKQYLGLLAAVLDERGVLRLDMTLAEAWPGIALPPGVDPAKVRLSQILSHQVPFKVPALVYRTTVTDAVPLREYGKVIAADATPRTVPFEYDNLGYLLYAAILERRTGRSWRDWLDREVLAPLNLTDTSSRSSRYRAADLTWRHQWDGKQWILLPPKPDATMHAAGGLMTSGTDLAKWLQAFLNRRGKGHLAPSVFERATSAAYEGEVSQENGFDCSGYALGWFVCRYGSDKLLLHGGAIDGARSLIAFAPEKGLGISVAVNSDSMTAALCADIVRLFFDSLNGVADAKERAKAVVAAYAAKPDQLARNRLAALEKDSSSDRWGGWSWSPDPRALDAYVGVYHSDAYGDLRVTRSGDGLVARIGTLSLRLRPAIKDVFAASSDALKRPEKFAFTRIGEGPPRELAWGKDVFVRTADGRS